MSVILIFFFIKICTLLSNVVWVMGIYRLQKAGDFLQIQLWGTILAILNGSCVVSDSERFFLLGCYQLDGNL